MSIVHRSFVKIAYNCLRFPGIRYISNELNEEVVYLKDVTKVEMFMKHSKDPIQWNNVNLAKHYRASIDRVDAVIQMIGTRHKKLKEQGFEISSNGEVVIPALWKHIYDTHVNIPTLPMETIANSVGMSNDVDGVKAIVDKMTEHYNRLQKVKEFEELSEAMNGADDSEDINEAKAEFERKVMELIAKHNKGSRPDK